MTVLGSLLLMGGSFYVVSSIFIRVLGCLSGLNFEGMGAAVAVILIVLGVPFMIGLVVFVIYVAWKAIKRVWSRMKKFFKVAK